MGINSYNRCAAPAHVEAFVVGGFIRVPPPDATLRSFSSTLEFECLDSRGPFPSRAAAERPVTEYIRGFYNPIRLHSTLGYKSPMEYEGAA